MRADPPGDGGHWGQAACLGESAPSLQMAEGQRRWRVPELLERQVELVRPGRGEGDPRRIQ